MSKLTNAAIGLGLSLTFLSSCDTGEKTVYSDKGDQIWFYDSQENPKNDCFLFRKRVSGGLIRVKYTGNLEKELVDSVVCDYFTNGTIPHFE